MKKLHPDATLPSQSTPQSIGYDLHSNNTKPIDIHPGTITIIPTGIAIQLPTKCYARIAPRSGLTLKNNLTTLAGVIDPDYRGDIGVILQNFGDSIQTIQPNQRITQLIFENAVQPKIEEVKLLQDSDRGSKGFGSTDQREALIKKLNVDLNLAMPTPYNIELSLNPFDNQTTRTIDIKPYNKHPTFGLITKMSDNNIQLTSCGSGTSTARLR